MSFEEEVKALIEKGPGELTDPAWRFDAFTNQEVLYQKKKGHLPAMGWNSWNAFGSGNTEALTLAMAEKLKELGLDKLGYRYVVLDDGCYQTYRKDGRILNEETKFHSGFRALAVDVGDMPHRLPELLVIAVGLGIIFEYFYQVFIHHMFTIR